MIQPLRHAFVAAPPKGIYDELRPQEEELGRLRDQVEAARQRVEAQEKGLALGAIGFWCGIVMSALSAAPLGVLSIPLRVAGGAVFIASTALLLVKFKRQTDAQKERTQLKEAADDLEIQVTRRRNEIEQAEKRRLHAEETEALLQRMKSSAESSPPPPLETDGNDVVLGTLRVPRKRPR